MENANDNQPILGIIVPTITFYDKSGTIQEPANRFLINHILVNNPNTLFLMGSTGEGLVFKDLPEEKRKYLTLVKTVLQEKYKNESPVNILIGIYGETPEKVKNDWENCKDIFINAKYVLPPPIGRKLRQEGQITFFSTVLSDITDEILLYNNPISFGGTDISKETVENLSKYNNFIGIKDSSGTIDKKKEYIQFISDTFNVGCGKEGMMGEFLHTIPIDKRKNASLVPSIGNVVNVCQEIYQKAILGHDEEMLEIQANLNSFRNNIYDSQKEKGKAQRGEKFAFSYMYKDTNITFSQHVMEPLQVENEDGEKRESIQKKIKDVIDDCIEKGFINLYHGE